MARIVGYWRLGVSVAIVGLGIVVLGSPLGADTVPPPAVDVGTALPPGWELCILQGVGATVTPDNVADLDEWQTAEGGSTNNTAAYNPFNTRLMTGLNGAALPAVVSSNGFPAFATWAAGCAATVATLLQSNMTPIVTALKAGDVSPPAVFLLDVDKSQWCAPSADGIPCYASEILAGSGSVGAALLTASSAALKNALTIYADATADLGTYDEDAVVVSIDQSLLVSQSQQLVATDDALSAAREKLSATTRALQQVALYDYTDSGAVNSDANLQLFEASGDTGIITQFLGNIAVSATIARYDRAAVAFKASEAQQMAAAAAVVRASSAVDAAQAAENRTLSKLVSDMQTIEAAGACTPAPTTTAPTTTAPTTTAPTTTAPTTTAPTTAATPTTVDPGGPGGADQAGLGNLQGCLAALAPVGVSVSGSAPS